VFRTEKEVEQIRQQRMDAAALEKQMQLAQVAAQGSQAMANASQVQG